MRQSEIPINTLDSTELLLQWKLMKALGYKSLWDADFRQEILNPYRKLLYYRLIILEEAEQYKFTQSTAKYVSDKLSFFADPELYKKVQQAEEKARLEDPETHATELAKAQDKLTKAEKKYIAPSVDEQEKMKHILSKNKPLRTFS